MTKRSIDAGLRLALRKWGLWDRLGDMSAWIRMEQQGSPCKYAVWQDESLNKNLRDLAGTLHSSTFERRLLVQVNYPPKSQSSKASSAAIEPSAKKYSWE